jgi:hypothetical protein
MRSTAPLHTRYQRSPASVDYVFDTVRWRWVRASFVFLSPLSRPALCDVVGCDSPVSHVTAVHRCGICHELGHGVVECGNLRAKLLLHMRSAHARLSPLWQCVCPGCPYPDTHVTDGHARYAPGDFYPPTHRASGHAPPPPPPLRRRRRPPPAPPSYVSPPGQSPVPRPRRQPDAPYTAPAPALAAVPAAVLPPPPPPPCTPPPMQHDVPGRFAYVGVLMPKHFGASMLCGVVENLGGLVVTKEDLPQNDLNVLPDKRCPTCRTFIDCARPVFVASACVACCAPCDRTLLLEPCRHGICEECYGRLL